MAGFDEPEDSPLFVDSRQKAFDRFAVQDLVSLACRGNSARVTALASPVIVVEGGRWHRLSARPATGLSPRREGNRPVPLDVTTALQTCSWTPPCVPVDPPTTGPGVTCQGQGCFTPTTAPAGFPTCVGTCYQPTCDVNAPTCMPGGCSATSATATCGATCLPAQCPTAVHGISVPRPGEIRITFEASNLLHYTLQYSTDLGSNEWSSVTNAQGNSGVLTFSHTNNASLSFYRLLVSQ